MTTPLLKLIGQTLNQEFPSAGLSESMTFTLVALGAYGGTVSAGKAQTETPYPCNGFVSTEKHEKIGDTLVEKTDSIVCILGASLAVTPTTPSKVTIGGVAMRVIDFEGSPAAWKLLCRS